MDIDLLVDNGCTLREINVIGVLSKLDRGQGVTVVVDNVAKTTGYTINEVIEALSELEEKEILRNIADNTYRVVTSKTTKDNMYEDIQ